MGVHCLILRHTRSEDTARQLVSNYLQESPSMHVHPLMLIQKSLINTPRYIVIRLYDITTTGNIGPEHTNLGRYFNE